MENLYPRLQQLRAELEDSAFSLENGPSVLYALRRELLRHYDNMPYAQLLVCPSGLRAQFYSAQDMLQQSPAFPAPSARAQYTSTERALSVLERVALCQGKRQAPLVA